MSYLISLCRATIVDSITTDLLQDTSNGPVESFPDVKGYALVFHEPHKSPVLEGGTGAGG